MLSLGSKAANFTVPASGGILIQEANARSLVLGLVKTGPGSKVLCVGSGQELTSVLLELLPRWLIQ